MSIKFGSESGYKTRIDYRVNQGELECGERVYMFIKNIEKTYTFENEQDICSIGVTGDPNLCYESVGLSIREDAIVKYLPTETALGQTPEVLEEFGNDGIAITQLACTPIKIRQITVELTASYKDIEAAPEPEDLLACTTSDGAYILGDLITLPAEGQYIRTSYSTDQPVDDFGTRSITYTKKIAYPTQEERLAYTTGIEVYYDEFDIEISSLEKEVTFRQGEVPMQRWTVTVYGVDQIYDNEIDAPV